MVLEAVVSQRKAENYLQSLVSNPSESSLLRIRYESSRKASLHLLAFSFFLASPHLVGSDELRDDSGSGCEGDYQRATGPSSNKETF